MLDIKQKVLEDLYNSLLKNKTKIIKHINDNYEIDNLLHICNDENEKH